MKTFYNWILGIEASVEDHLRPLTTIIKKLEQYAVDMEIKAVAFKDEAEAFMVRNVRAVQESDAANKAASKIKSLIS